MGDEDNAGPSHRGTSEPLYGATPPPTHASPSAQVAPSGESARGSSNPLYGAMPESSPSSSQPNAPHKATTSILTSPPPKVPSRPSSSPHPRSTSSIPAFLRRITFILSLILGASSAIALVFSALVLPRLHVSYSARKALADQQATRIGQLLETLRGIRSLKLYGPTAPLLEQSSGIPETTSGTAGTQVEEKRAAFEEIPSTASSTTGDAHEFKPSTTTDTHLSPDLAPLRLALSHLAETRSNTSTTRSSLLSTLESYTSSLHRALWSPRPGHGRYAVGLNSLNANLAKERHGAGSSAPGTGAYSGSSEGSLGELGISDRGEEYDAVRREIRGIKGMLLNRRNFTPLSAGAG